MDPHRVCSSARRRLLIAAGATLAGCVAPQYVAGPAQPPPAPSVRTGDRWRYAQFDLYRGEQTDELTMQAASVAPQLRVTVADRAGERRPEEVYTVPWRAIQDPSHDPVAVFQHPNPLLPGQLVAGARERIVNRWRPPGGERWLFWSEWVDALGWERVAVPAGEFVALRVLRRIAFDHSDPFRERSARQETLWYAPSVNRWVRREWTGTYFWPGMRLDAPLREDWTRWVLLEYRPA